MLASMQLADTWANLQHEGMQLTLRQVSGESGL